MSVMIQCPHCSTIRTCRPMRAHLMDAHGLTSREAHPICNPNDKQSARFGGKIQPRKAVFDPDDFDLIDDGDI